MRIAQFRWSRMRIAATWGISYSVKNVPLGSAFAITACVHTKSATAESKLRAVVRAKTAFSLVMFVLSCGKD